MFPDVKAVAFDLDGTIYFGNEIADGALELIESLKQKGIRVFYFTNNSVRSRIQIHEKLLKLGLKLSVDHVYTSSYATAVYASEKSLTDVFCIGSQGLIDELRLRDIHIVDCLDKVQALIVGLDAEFNYNKLTRALHVLQQGCRLIACNRDRNYPIENGRLMPGCGPIIAAIETAYGVEADFVVGKPNTYMLQLLASDWQLTNKEILVVGDSYSSDIEMAKKYNSPSALIYKGEIDVSDTLVIPNLKDLGRFI